VFGGPAVAAAEPSCVAPSEYGGGGKAATPALDRGCGEPAPRHAKAVVAGPAAPAAGAVAALLNRPARWRRRYSVEAHGPQTR